MPKENQKLNLLVVNIIGKKNRFSITLKILEKVKTIDN